MVVALKPIDESNVRAVFSLTVAPGQEHFVAPNPWSLAQALAEHEIAWPRAIAADDTIVGFSCCRSTTATRVGGRTGCGG